MNSTQKPHPVDVAMSEMAFGHGQGTEEERVERAARELSRRLPGLFQGNVIARDRANDLARAILAAADAVPGPEVKWTTEPPVTKGEG